LWASEPLNLWGGGWAQEVAASVSFHMLGCLHSEALSSYPNCNHSTTQTLALNSLVLTTNPTNPSTTKPLTHTIYSKERSVLQWLVSIGTLSPSDARAGFNPLAARLTDGSLINELAAALLQHAGSSGGGGWSSGGGSLGR